MEEAKKALAVNKEKVKKGKEKHEKEVDTFKQELKEDTCRGLFDMKLTEKQMRGVPIKVVFPELGYKRKPAPLSPCCHEPMINYRTLYSAGHAEKFYRCKKCWRDCPVRTSIPNLC